MHLRKSFRARKASRDEFADRFDVGIVRKHVPKKAPWKGAATAKFGWRRVLKSDKLLFRPLRFRRIALRKFFLALTAFRQKARIFRPGGNRLVELATRALYFYFLFRTDRENVTLIVELRTPRATKDLLRDARLDERLVIRRPFQKGRKDDGTRRKIHSCGERLRTHAEGEELLLEKMLHNALIFG